MSHNWSWQYEIWSIHRHPGELAVGDPVVLTTLDDKSRSFRKAKALEIPDGFVHSTEPDHEYPGTHIVNASMEGTAQGVKVHGLNGLSVLPHQSQSVFYRPATAMWDGDKGKDGVVGAVVQNPRYDYPLASGNDLEINKLLVVKSTTPTLGVLEMPRENVHAGDHVYIANEDDSGQTIKVTDLHPPSPGVREIKVKPGKTLLLRRNNTDDGWEQDTSVTSIVTVDIHFDARWIRNDWPVAKKPVEFVAGQLLCRGFGNLRSNRATNARWHVPPDGSPATVDSNHRTRMRLPDPDGKRIGILVVVSSNADGSGVLYHEHVFAGTTPHIPATSSKGIQVAFERESGKATVELRHTASDTSDWGADAYLSAYDLVGEV